MPLLHAPQVTRTDHRDHHIWQRLPHVTQTMSKSGNRYDNSRPQFSKLLLNTHAAHPTISESSTAKSHFAKRSGRSLPAIFVKNKNDETSHTKYLLARKMRDIEKAGNWVQDVEQKQSKEGVENLCEDEHLSANALHVQPFCKTPTLCRLLQLTDHL